MKAISRLIFASTWALLMAACDSSTEPPPPPATGTITGTILLEGEPLGGVTVNLTGPASASTVSIADGTFTFTSVQEGQYTVSISGLSAEVQFAQTANAVTVGGGQTATVLFTGTFVRTASISGTVLVDGVGFPGLTLTLTGTETGTTTSDGSGVYSFPGLRAGTFTVTLSGVAADLTFSVTQRQVTLGVGEVAALDFSGIQEVPAHVTIFALENDRGFRINANAVRDEVIVLVDVEPGTQTVTKVTLFLDAENVGEQELPSAAAFGQQRAPQRLRFEVNTTTFDPNTGGPLFPNGSATLTAVVDTEQQGAGAEQTTLSITLVNTDLISGINFLGGAGGVVAGGRVWWGGGDLNFEIVPVIYDPNRTISAIDVTATGQASPNGGASMDFGSGLGVAHRITGPPFLFTATQARNDGFVEDDPTRGGHTIRVVKVLDGNGLDITTDFLPGRATPLTGLHVDFVGPQSNLATRLNVDGDVIIGGEWFSGGAFGLSPAASETGVGGVTHRFDVSAGGLPVATNVAGIPDLGERGPFYRLELISMVDGLGNQGPAANVTVANLFGVDRTAPTIMGVIPTTTVILNPDDDAGDGIADNRPAFTASDPILSDGTAGSGFNEATAIGEDAIGTVFDMSSRIAPNATGLNTLDPSILAQSTYTFDFGVTDNAQPVNFVTASVSFVIDRTNPITNMLNPPAGTVFSSNASLSWTISGNASDANGLYQVRIVVRDADSGGTSGICDPVDDPVTRGTGPAQVVENTFDVTATADDFSVVVQVFNAGGVATVQTLCFYIEADDAATDVNGNPEPNTSIAVARTVITWN